MKVKQPAKSLGARSTLLVAAKKRQSDATTLAVGDHANRSRNPILRSIALVTNGLQRMTHRLSASSTPRQPISLRISHGSCSPIGASRLSQIANSKHCKGGG